MAWNQDQNIWQYIRKGIINCSCAQTIIRMISQCQSTDHLSHLSSKMPTHSHSCLSNVRNLFFSVLYYVHWILWGFVLLLIFRHFRAQPIVNKKKNNIKLNNRVTDNDSNNKLGLCIGKNLAIWVKMLKNDCNTAIMLLGVKQHKMNHIHKSLISS